MMGDFLRTIFGTRREIIRQIHMAEVSSERLREVTQRHSDRTRLAQQRERENDLPLDGDD